jgi:glucosylceramidase
MMNVPSKNLTRGVITLTFALLLGGANLTKAQTVSVWLTTHDLGKKMQPQAAVAFTSGTGGTNSLLVDETQSYQQVEGFGASFTDSAAYLLNQVATPAARSNAMNNLFTRNGSGIGVSFVRNPMGGSDLARTHYSYDDLPAGQTDVSLTNFSVAHDQADIIPLVQQALQLNPQLTIMANPWSPPGWMKTSGSMIGGSLLPNMHAPFARYFVRYIQAYQAAGIPTHYISLQNEPLYVPNDYPGMYMDAANQVTVLRDHLLPALVASNITTKVLVYDHNWDQPGYPQTVFSDPALLASSQVAGTAWHGYGGTPGVMLTLANQFPTKGNYQTEHSGGSWVGDQMRQDFTEIIHVMRCSGRAYVKWSLAQDQNSGPNLGGCNSCRGLVTVHSSSGAVSYTTDYYTLGHFSKFVLPGATRVYSANANGVVSAAFKNPDGSKALVVFNDTTSSKTFQVQWGGQSFSYTLASYAGATFTWVGTQLGANTVNPANQIQGSSFNAVSGLQTEWTSDSVGGYNLGYCDHGDYAVYRNVDFGAGFTNVTTRVAAFAGGFLEFRLDSAGGALIGSVTMPNTGDWQTYSNVSGSITGATGVHDLYLVFKGGGSVANLNSFQFGGAIPGGASGMATQLIWTTQPGGATNGSPFAQQPVLQTADQYGNPTTNGLPATLGVVIAPSAGTGPLLGTTNFNLGMAGWRGVFQFTDLQINANGTNQQLTALIYPTNAPSGNLLINGDFNSPNSALAPDGWTAWVLANGGWANHENNVGVTLDGSYYMVNGGFANQGGGLYQIRPGTSGRTYTLSVQSGADAWWLPYGEMRFFFLDSNTNPLATHVQPTVDPAAYGTNNYDIPHPWNNYSLTATAPSGTTQIKVEFAAPNGTGSVWFENAVLTEGLSPPLLAGGSTLPFTVHPGIPPTSQTNYIVGITGDASGVCTLQFIGTLGVQYCVQMATNLAPPILWAVVAGSTNTVTNLSGLWVSTITNSGLQGFYRSAAISP